MQSAIHVVHSVLAVSSKRGGSPVHRTVFTLLVCMVLMVALATHWRGGGESSAGPPTEHPVTRPSRAFPTKSGQRLSTRECLCGRTCRNQLLASTTETTAMAIGRRLVPGPAVDRCGQFTAIRPGRSGAGAEICPGGVFPLHGGTIRAAGEP